jgi:sporulation protein YabP
MEDKRVNSGFNSELNHNIIMEDRKKISLTGVVDIHSFDDELILTETQCGILTIKGSDLKMNKLNLENNELIVEGQIMALIYSENDEVKKSGVFGKLFK